VARHGAGGERIPSRHAAQRQLAFLFFLTKVPETKDRTLEQIQHELTEGDQQHPPPASAPAGRHAKDHS